MSESMPRGQALADIRPAREAQRLAGNGQAPRATPELPFELLGSSWVLQRHQAFARACLDPQPGAGLPATMADTASGFMAG